MRPTKHDCQIKEILYPITNRKPTKNFRSNNYRQIKLIQEQNRLKKQKQDTYVARKKFFKINSKFYIYSNSLQNERIQKYTF